MCINVITLPQTMYLLTIFANIRLYILSNNEMKKIYFTLLGLSILLTTFAQSETDTSFKKYIEKIPNSNARFMMVPIPAGSFTIGSGANDANKQVDETPQKKIAISAFWMGAGEVTYDEYNLYFTDAQLSANNDVDAVTRPTTPYIDLSLGMGKEGGFPVSGLKQYNALMYCKWLYNRTGVFYRLPTEAEWEYACRAGATTIYPFGDSDEKLKDYAWYKKGSKDAYHKIGTKKPNAWGLYDMLGNVSEWVLDQYQEDYYSTLKDGDKDPVRVPDAKNPRLVRGGSYKDDAAELRCANRIPSELKWNARDPQMPKSKWWNADASFVGFRIVRPYQQPTKEEAEKFFNTYLQR